MSGDERTRRDILQATAGVAAGTTVIGHATAAESAAEHSPHEAIPTTTEEIRAAFDDVPRLENPSEKERSFAHYRFPEVVVPESGPIPDPQNEQTVTLDAPPWLLATVFDLTTRNDGGEATRQSVEDRFLSRYQAWEEWRLPDGTDAVDVILDAVAEGDDG